MIINADSLLPHLKDKLRPNHSDASRHLLCPDCKIRTKLNTLGDGRRKCASCGKKFRIHKATDETKVRQCAEILMCFCLDFSAHRTSEITHHRYRLVAPYYDHFRTLLAEFSLSPEKILLFTDHAGDIQTVGQKSKCRWCKSAVRLSASGDKPPVFGIELQENGRVSIDPLGDDEAVSEFEKPGRYAAFLCCGAFHRFSKEEPVKDDNAERLWNWMKEPVESRRGMWKKNTGYYLKELEWRYNHKSLHPDAQAKKVIDLMPKDFLAEWL